MKIGIVLSSTPSYSETFFISKIKGLQQHGYEVILFVNHQKSEFDLCKVKSFPVNRGFGLIKSVLSFLILIITKPAAIRKFIKYEKKVGIGFSQVVKKVFLYQHIFRTLNLDWLHFGFATQAIGKEHIAKAIGAKMAVSLRGFDIGIYPLKNPKCYDLLWVNIDKLHVISDDLLNLAYENGLKKGIFYQKITPAINTSFFKRQSFSETSKKEQLQLMTIGRLHWKKDYTSVIIALKSLKDRNVNFEYVIIGDGPEEEKLKYFVYEFGLVNQVVFTGKISQSKIINYFENSDIYIQYSLQEGFCNAVLEAQAMGVLPIVSDAEGLSENVLHKETGWVVPKYKPKLLTKQLLASIQISEKEKNKMTINAIDRVSTEFNIEKQQKEFIEFYSN